MAATDRAPTLVLLTGGVMIAGTLLKAHIQPNQGAKKTGTAVFDATHEIWAIVIVMVIMTFVAEQAPGFAGPFALLVLVAYLLKNTVEIQAWIAQATGSNSKS